MQVLNGFVKIHRKLLQWGWYQDNVVKGVFLHLLLTAAFQDSMWMGRMIKKGQVVTSYNSLAQDLGFGVRQIRTAINKLKSTGEITSEATNKFTIITVVNWEEYQCFEKEVTNETTNKETFNRQATDIQETFNRQHRKNVKNVKNVKNSVCDTTHAPDHSLKIPFAEFVTMTNAEYNALIEKYGESDTKRMIEILDNHKGMTGKQYQSDYRAILSWVWDRLDKEKQSGKHSDGFNPYEDNFNHVELEALTRGDSNE